MLFYSGMKLLQAEVTGSYAGLEYSLEQHSQLLKPQIGENPGGNNVGMVNYMLNNPPQQQLSSSTYGTSTSIDKINFSEVMQFADFGPKLALNQTKMTEEENEIDPVYFLKFPVLNDRLQSQNLVNPPLTGNKDEFDGISEGRKVTSIGLEEDEEARISENSLMQLGFLGGTFQKNPSVETKNRRKRPRSVKTSEEVESQRMTHIAVERNRRKQMNEHLRVLRSLMPGSYVQRVRRSNISLTKFIVQKLEIYKQFYREIKHLSSVGRSSLLENWSSYFNV